MKLLYRYIFKEFIRTSLTVLAGILVLFVCVTFLKEADEFIRHKASAAQIAKYYLYSVPGMAGQAMPFAVLIGTLLSLGNLSRYQEITAMRAGGSASSASSRRSSSAASSYRASASLTTR
jgi:lipopolysaccharide export system permease protein